MERIIQNANTVLVTGGAGAIGMNLVKMLLELGVNKVVVIDNLASGSRDNLPSDKRCVFVEGDVANKDDLKKVFEHKPEVVYHLAASFANQRSIDNPGRDLLVNGHGTLNVLELSKQHKVKKLVYFSSSCVYGHKNSVMKETDSDLDPTTPYAITKLLGEYYCKFFYQHYGLPVVILRIFNSFGPGEVSGKYRNVIPNFIAIALKKKPLTVTGTGNESRNFTFVGEVVKATILASVTEEAVGKTINIASDKHETKIIDLAQKINKLTGNPAGIEFVPQRDWDTIKTRRGDISLLKSLFGFEPAFDLDEKLEETIKWFQDTGVE